MSIKPLHDRVLVKRIESEELSIGGIIIPDTAKEKPIKGEIVAVGQGRHLDNGSIRPLVVAVGNKVLFSKYGGTDVKIDGQEFLIMREDDILGIIE